MELICKSAILIIEVRILSCKRSSGPCVMSERPEISQAKVQNRAAQDCDRVRSEHRKARFIYQNAHQHKVSEHRNHPIGQMKPQQLRENEESWRRSCHV